MSWFVTVIVGFLVYSCGQIRGDWCLPATPECMSAKMQSELEDRVAALRKANYCHTPRLVSSINGINLYVTKDENCDRDIYFSSSGTHTTHEECHSSGKNQNL